MPSDRLSQHFTKHELSCPCCGLLIACPRLVAALEELREKCGNQPIHINSATRCPEWNRTVGGVRGSQHLSGRAADIVVEGMHPLEVAAKAEQVTAFSHGGIGVYPSRGFVHVDVRNGVARWDG